MVKNYINIINSNRFLPYAINALLILLLLFTGYLLNEQKKELVAKKVVINELNRDLNLLDKILTDKKTNEGKIKIVSESLPSSYEETALAIYRFESLANKNRQNLETAIDKTTKQELNGLNSLGFTLKTSGSYNDFSQMMSDLFNLPYFTNVDSLQIGGISGNLSTQTNFKLFMGGSK